MEAGTVIQFLLVALLAQSVVALIAAWYMNYYRRKWLDTCKELGATQWDAYNRGKLLEEHLGEGWEYESDD